MSATPVIPERRLLHFRGPHRFQGFMTPLPERRHWEHETEEDPRDWGPWWGRKVHPEIHGMLRGMAVLLLWLLAVLGMFALFAQFWR